VSSAAVDTQEVEEELSWARTTKVLLSLKVADKQLLFFFAIDAEEE